MIMVLGRNSLSVYVVGTLMEIPSLDRSRTLTQDLLSGSHMGSHIGWAHGEPKIFLQKGLINSFAST